MRGSDVVQLQYFLIAQKLLAAGNATGYFGKLTQAAVQAFQRSRGIVSGGTPATTGYGIVGPKTRAALSSCITRTPPSPAATTTPLSPPAAPSHVSNSGTPAYTEPTLASPPRDSLSVQDFGAMCDTVEHPSEVNEGAATGHDDFPAFVAAVHALPPTGGTISVPLLGTGKCLWKLQAGMNPSLKLPSNVTLRMDDRIRILVEGTPNQVNGYSNAAITNAHVTNQVVGGGDSNVNVLGGAFKAAGPRFGTVFVTFKGVRGGQIHTRFLDNNGSARAQVAYSNDIDVNIYVGYESGPWTKVVQPGNASKWAYEDGFRIGSGSWNIRLQGEINSGDDSVAISNERSETDGATAGADIHDIVIGPVRATSRAGNTLRIFHAPEMIAGVTRSVFVNELSGTPVSAGQGATGISIADYSNRRAIRGITLSNTTLDVNGVSGLNAGAVSLINTDQVKFVGLKVTGANSYGIAAADAVHTEYHDIDISGNPGSIDGASFGPYGPTQSTGSDRSILDRGRISGFGRDNVHIEGSNDVSVGNLELSRPGRSNVRIVNALRTIVLPNTHHSVSSEPSLKEETGSDYSHVYPQNTIDTLVGTDPSSVGTHSVYENVPNM